MSGDTTRLMPPPRRGPRWVDMDSRPSRAAGVRGIVLAIVHREPRVPLAAAEHQRGDEHGRAGDIRAADGRTDCGTIDAAAGHDGTGSDPGAHDDRAAADEDAVNLR